MAKFKWIKKSFLFLLTISVFIGIFSDFFTPKVSADALDGKYQQEINSIINRFGTSESFIQEYLDKNYTLRQIFTAFLKAEEDNISFEAALERLFPSEENQSVTVTSEVYSNLSAPLLNVINGVELDQSSIVKRYNFFPVTEAVYSDLSSVTDDVYLNQQSKSLTSLNKSSGVNPPPVLEKAPKYSKSSFNEAPYSIDENK